MTTQAFHEKDRKIQQRETEIHELEEILKGKDQAIEELNLQLADSQGLARRAEKKLEEQRYVILTLKEQAAKAKAEEEEKEITPSAPCGLTSRPHYPHRFRNMYGNEFACPGITPGGLAFRDIEPTSYRSSVVLLVSAEEETPQPAAPTEWPVLPDPFDQLAQAALSRFLGGYEEYGPGAADALGLAGQWGDLHRKVMKLKREMWGGEEGTLTRESGPEILEDVIGHCLLALDMYDRDFVGGRG